MNNNTVEEIKNLIPELPKKDIILGQKFLLNRDFESLQMLVNSAIIKVERNLKKEIVEHEYLEINLDKLEELKVKVDEYYEQIAPSENIYDDTILDDLEDYY